MKKPIYLDNHATTPCDPRVLEAMLPFFSERFGNAASRTHLAGENALGAVERAREEIASLVGAEAKEIIFTSGTTESVNLALKGAARGTEDRFHIITSTAEHNAVLDSCRALEKEGYETTYLPVDGKGKVDTSDLVKALSSTNGASLVSLIHASNEIGTIFPLKELSQIVHEAGSIFHVDAAQSAGKLPIDVRSMGIDMMSFSAHKMYGPKGIGALYLRAGKPRIKLKPLMDGGGHERGLRPGTINVPAAVGFGKACSIAAEEMREEFERVSTLRDLMQTELLLRLENSNVNGEMENRLPGNLSITLNGVEGESLLLIVDDLAMSSGSACTSANPEPSHVLRAIGLSEEEARSTIRIGIGRFNTSEEIDFAVNRIVEAVASLRSLSSVDS